MVLAVSKKFDYESCKQEIPMFWKEHYAKGMENMSAGCWNQHR